LDGSDVSLPGLGTGITVEVHQLVGNFPEAQILLRMLSTAADFELDESHVIKNEKAALDTLRVRQNVFLVENGIIRKALV